MDDTRWRNLCALIMDEKNPDKVWDLVDQLNKALDERERTLRGGEAAKGVSRAAGRHAPEDST
ncbi:MAG TPA: hypothetical protein VJX16_02480 [Terriglobales bacterium]|nr:hypothetical protein [Terriglobales bacterium]